MCACVVRGTKRANEEREEKNKREENPENRPELPSLYCGELVVLLSDVGSRLLFFALSPNTGDVRCFAFHRHSLSLPLACQPLRSISQSIDQSNSRDLAVIANTMFSRLLNRSVATTVGRVVTRSNSSASHAAAAGGASAASSKWRRVGMAVVGGAVVGLTALYQARAHSADGAAPALSPKEFRSFVLREVHTVRSFPHTLSRVLLVDRDRCCSLARDGSSTTTPSSSVLACRPRNNDLICPSPRAS